MCLNISEIKIMENVLNFLNNILCFGRVNEGYIGLTSFEKPKHDKIRRPELPEDDEAPVLKQSFTGLLKRV